MVKIRCKGLDGNLNVDEGYDGLGTLRHTLRSMQANKKQGIGNPKAIGPINPLAAATDIGHLW